MLVLSKYSRCNPWKHTEKPLQVSKLGMRDVCENGLNILFLCVTLSFLYSSWCPVALQNSNHKTISTISACIHSGFYDMRFILLYRIEFHLWPLWSSDYIPLLHRFLVLHSQTYCRQTAPIWRGSQTCNWGNRGCLYETSGGFGRLLYTVNK